VQEKARRDDRVVWAERVDADLMARSPVLVWRNVTRVKLIRPSAWPMARRTLI
jgi:exodeoxyribonuclease-5